MKGEIVIQIKTIHNYDDFIEALHLSGMTLGGTNGKGVFTLCDYFSELIQWHIEDPVVDPWEWRMRVLDERNDIAYGKLFFKSTGYITKEWYPYFYAVRRDKSELEYEYESGTISFYANEIYKLIKEHGALPLHIMKQYLNIDKSNKSKFDSALVELQMKMYITICGKADKRSHAGEKFGWSSTVFCLTEEFFDDSVMEKANQLTKEEAYDIVEKHILELNPKSDMKKVKKFILG